MAEKRKKKETTDAVYVPEPVVDERDNEGFAFVKQWVIANNDDIEAMDWLNKTTYPFTTRYEQRQYERGQGRFN